MPNRKQNNDIQKIIEKSEKPVFLQKANKHDGKTRVLRWVHVQNEVVGSPQWEPLDIVCHIDPHERWTPLPVGIV